MCRGSLPKRISTDVCWLRPAIGSLAPFRASIRLPPTKQKDLDEGIPLAGRLAQLLGDLPILLAASLWANRVDRSLWPSSDQTAAARTAEVLGLDRSQRLLADDTAATLDLLTEARAMSTSSSTTRVPNSSPTSCL